MWPFYTWFINLCLNLGWLNFFIVSTVQKIIGFFLMYNYCLETRGFLLPVVFNIIFGFLSSLSQRNLRLILCYLAIINQSWLMLSLVFRFGLFLFFMAGYTCYNFFFFFYLEILDFNSIGHFRFFFNFFFFFNLLSIVGCPPIVRFFIKLVVLFFIIKKRGFFLFFFMIFFSLACFLVYSRFFFFIFYLNKVYFFFSYFFSRRGFFLVNLSFNLFTPIFFLFFKASLLEYFIVNKKVLL